MNQQMIKRVVLIGGGAALLLVLAYVFILGFQSRDKTATLDIQSAVPDDITVTVDGTKVNSTAKVPVTPGSHTVEAKRTGFEGKTQTADVKSGETKVVRLLLKPNGEEGYAWARAHPEAFSEFEAVSSQNYDQSSENVTAQYPLTTQLPVVRRNWRIDYGSSTTKPGAIAITITYSGIELDKQDALDWIRQQGYNVADYEIIFKTPPQPGG